MMNKPKEPFSTLNHLDPWFNNMLFQFVGESSQPEDVLLLDFQVKIHWIYGENYLDSIHLLFAIFTMDFSTLHSVILCPERSIIIFVLFKY